MAGVLWGISSKVLSKFLLVLLLTLLLLRIWDVDHVEQAHQTAVKAMAIAVRVDATE